MTIVLRRLLGLAQLLLGGVSLARPSATVSALTAGRGSVPDPRIVRVLGARQLVQGTVLLAQPDAEVLAAGAVIDAVHAASLIPIIALSGRYRIAALVSAMLAACAAAGGARLTTVDDRSRNEGARHVR